MKKILGKSFVISGVTAALMAVGVMSNAHAIAMGSASSSIDWSTMSIATANGVSVSLDTEFSVNETFTSANNTAGGSQFSGLLTYDGSDSLGYSAVSGSAGSASARANGLSGLSVASGTGVAGGASASSYASRSAEFTVAGSGLVTFTFQYVLSAIAMSQELFENAYAYADALLFVENVSAGVSLESSNFTEASATDGSSDGLAGPMSGFLSVSMLFADGDYGYLFTDTYTGADQNSNAAVLPVAVPAPASILLILAGLLGLGFGRKQHA